MYTVWKIYIPFNLQPDTDSVLLIGWKAKNVKNEIIIASYVFDPVELTTNDVERQQILQKLDSINCKRENDNKLNDFECDIIGSTNIDDDCSDLMRIYDVNTWLQFDKHFQLKQILSTNKEDVNDYYLIEYQSTDPRNIFSPYYTQSTSAVHLSFTPIVQLCNESFQVHSYFHATHTKNRQISCLRASYLLCKYFEIIHVLYGYFYAFILYLSPLYLLPESRIARERRFNMSKFEAIIHYFEAQQTKSYKHYNNTECQNIDKKRKQTLHIWCNIAQHFINLICGATFGYFLYFYLDQEFQTVLEYLKLFDYNSIKCHIDYLMGIPVGLKLNAHLNDVFGRMSLLCLEILHVQIPYALITIISPTLVDDGMRMDHNQFLSIWDIFSSTHTKKRIKCDDSIDAFSWIHMIILYVSFIKLYIAIVSSCFGITFVIALISDAVSFLCVPFTMLHHLFLKGYQLEAKMLSICGKLFRGLKYNQLKHKVDICVFDRDQLFVGIILFSMFTFLLPTIAVYFVYFSVIMIYIWTFQSILDIIQIIVHYLSISSVIFLWVNPKFICNGFDVCIVDKKCIHLQINTKSNGTVGCLRDSIQNIIIPKLSKDIPQMQFIQKLKLNMY